MTDDYTSILDKTDWRKTIHKALEEAVLSIGKGKEFFYNVEQAIQAMSATYPNWDAYKEVQGMVKTISKRYGDIALTWINEHPYDWAYDDVKESKKYEWRDKMYLEILQFLQNIAGKHRMLLWGIRSLPTGSMENGDASGNKTDM